MSPRSASARHLVELLQQWELPSSASYEALAQRIRLLIIDGRIAAGATVPSERALAAELHLSRTTVNAAYSSLRASGFLTSIQGSGSVARVPGRPGDLPVPRPADRIDLSRATSSAAPGVVAAAQRALERLPERLATDGYELAGVAALRQALAERYTRAGVPTSAEEVIVTSGAQSAISLLTRVFVRTGDRAVVESPGYPHATQALRVMGARLVPMLVHSEDGWDVDGFEASVRRTEPAVAYVMPDFHNPTSLSMTLDDRHRIVRAAQASNTLLLIDETTAELDIDRGAELPSVLALTRRAAGAVSIGSASKTIWGGLRIGWIRGSAELLDRVIAARLANDLGASIIDQLVMIEMLQDFEATLRFRREALRASRDALVGAVTAALPAWRIAPVHGGIAAWVSLGEPISSALTLAARQRGLLLGAGPWFGLGGEYERFIRIPITATPEELRRSVAILAEATATLEANQNTVAKPHPTGFR